MCRNIKTYKKKNIKTLFGRAEEVEKYAFDHCLINSIKKTRSVWTLKPTIVFWWFRKNWMGLFVV